MFQKNIAYENRTFTKEITLAPQAELAEGGFVSGHFGLSRSPSQRPPGGKRSAAR